MKTPPDHNDLMETFKALSGMDFHFERSGLYPLGIRDVSEKGHHITVEFCVGDYCVGLFDPNFNLMGEKIRCHSADEVVAAVNTLLDFAKDNVV